MVNFICSSSLCLGVTVSWPRAQQQLLQQQMNKDSAVKRSWTSVLTVGSCHHALRQLGKRRFQVHLSRQIKIMNYNKLALWLWLQHLRDKRTVIIWNQPEQQNETKTGKKEKKNAINVDFFFLWKQFSSFFPPKSVPASATGTHALQPGHRHSQHLHPLFTFPVSWESRLLSTLHPNSPETTAHCFVLTLKLTTLTPAGLLETNAHL